jgi:hypothetical protein
VKKLILAIVIIAAATALALAPSLSSTVLATKHKTCTVGESSTPCNDTTSTTPAAHTKCTAGVGTNSPNCAGAKP